MTGPLAADNSDVERDKIIAETEKLSAEANQARIAAARMNAEIGKLAAEARKANAEALAAEHGAEVARMQRAEYEHAFAVEQTKDSRHHVYWFSTPVSDAAVQLCVKQLTTWHRMHPDAGFEIVFNSPGGSVIAGMALFDFLRSMSAQGHHITTVVRGYAASMAGILLQAGDTRKIGPESYLMIHEISAGTAGKIGEIKDDVKFYETVCSRVVDIFVNRSGGKCTKAKFIKNWTRIDWWLTSEETLALGFADEIA